MCQDQIRLVVVGGGGHAVVVSDAFLRTESCELVGFVAKRVDVSLLRGIAPVLGEEAVLAELANNGRFNAVAVAIGDNHTRKLVMGRLRSELPRTVSFPAIVHPSAVIGSRALIGDGSVLLAGAVIGPGARVGECCIVNTRASLDHHGVLRDYASLAPGVTTGGDVVIGEGSAVSIGATVLHGRSIGDWSVVGAGATVIEDVPDGVVAYGTPARVVRKREPGDKYL